MRKGFNPNKDKELVVEVASHRVIIPIYIPNNKGYFAEAFDVLKVCVSSLLGTINADTKISLISNNATAEVNDYLRKLWDDGLVDRVIFNAQNVGKMNAIIAETRASFEEFITYADADVFFDKGWLKQTYTVFDEVPLAGFVSMNPTPENLSFAESTIFANFLSGKKKKKPVSEVCNYDDLLHFHKSIGRDASFTSEMFNTKNVHLIKDYIIGAGHFCCTIKKTPTLKYVPKDPSGKAVSGKSENIYLDIPFNKTGFYRLSSNKAYVWHMGNTLENDWADQKIQSIRTFTEEHFSFSNLPIKKQGLATFLFTYKFRLLKVRVLKKLKFI